MNGSMYSASKVLDIKLKRGPAGEFENPTFTGYQKWLATQAK